jgi:WD40 repeat protein
MKSSARNDATGAVVPAVLARTVVQSALTGEPASALVQAILRGLALTRLKIAATVLSLCAAVAVGTGLALAPTPSGEQPAQTKMPAENRPRKTDSQKSKTDLYGDPLPIGAVRRLGTLRFRHGGGHINRLLLSHDGKVLVSKCYGFGLPKVSVWEFPSGKLLRQLPGDLAEERAVALSPDDKTIAIGQNSLTNGSATIFFYELVTGREIRQLKSPVEEVRGLAFSPDGKYLTSGHVGHGVLLWDLKSGTVQAQLPAKSRLTLLAFSPDGKTLAAGDNLNISIQLFDVITRKQRHQLDRPSQVQDFAFSPDGSMFVVGARDGAISVWNPATGKLIREFRSPSKYFGAVAWSPDGQLLAASEYDATKKSEFIRFWDPSTGKERGRTKGKIGQPENLTFSTDGKVLISGGRDSIIRLWDVATGEERTPAAEHNSVYSLSVSPDGKTLVYGDTNIHLWHQGEGRELGILPGQDSGTAFLCCAFSPDGRLLAGTQDPNNINVWDVQQRRLVHRLAIDLEKKGRKWCSFFHVTFSPDGKILAMEAPAPHRQPAALRGSKSELN